jgi:hypothetical protein
VFCIYIEEHIKHRYLAEDIAKVVEHLPSKHEVLNSNPNTTKKWLFVLFCLLGRCSYHLRNFTTPLTLYFNKNIIYLSLKEVKYYYYVEFPNAPS